MGKLTDNQRKTMTKLFESNGLNEDDVFTHRHYVIIARSGIEKIQFKNNIDVSYSEVVVQPDFVVIKATAKVGDKVVETYGEAHKSNCQNSYFVAMAEKRALSRATLKSMNLYQLGVFGEDEADDFKRR
jgi:hypothetical protein